MSDLNDQNRTNRSAEDDSSKPSAFCQSCGKGLDHETQRVVGTSVYCEPCLAARLSGGRVYAGSSQSTAYGPQNYTAGVAIPTGEPNPGLAALLGLIPGVGAMYNEQYAKGIVHLVIFAVLVSLAQVSGLFGLFIGGWEFYMAIEAHHTAKARRDGTPLPNPFGFNDIGERLGFGKAWPSGGPDVGGVARDAANAAAAGFAGVGSGVRPGTPAPPATPPPQGFSSAPPAAGWGAPVDAYARYSAPFVAPSSATPPPAGSWQTHPYGSQNPPGYGAPFTSPTGFVPPGPPMMPAMTTPSRFPAGALWLIGIGTIFLLGTTGIFRHVSPGIFVGVILIGLGIWVFLRMMTESGLGLSNDGTADYQLRLVRALKPTVWLILFGLLSLLNDLHILRWEYSWPWLIILAGVMMLLTRAAYHSAAAAMYASAATEPIAAPQPPSQSHTATPAKNPEDHLPQGGN